MPFNNFFPRSFTEAGVQAYAPVASGVYGISNAQGWIFVGETADIQTSLLNHLRQTEAALLRHQPTGFVYELASPTVRTSRCDRLIEDYNPLCNRPRSRY